ncbi:DUF4192 domain-containing protein [Streptomyces sp. NPDC048718]|uniref:DUF4192 domain-containing protein n=1 Tax=Streptomyces sp. NPDC048718 TaxID=3365587 RepID=UPI003723B3D1
MSNIPRQTGSSPSPQQIVLRGPAELADALPFILGFHPSDSIVLVALHGERARFGGRVRVGIPSSPRDWAALAGCLAECLVEGSARRGERPDAVVGFLCQEPARGETGRRAMERLRPLAQSLRIACGRLDVPVLEVLCISDGLYFSYCCPDGSPCCPADGTPLALAGTSVMAASAAYAGVQVRGTLKDMEARLKPRCPEADAAAQRAALNDAAAVIVPRILDGPSGADARQETRETAIDLVHRLVRRLSEASASAPVSVDLAADTGRGRGANGGAGLSGPARDDARDDALISPDEAATLILALQDRETRDRAAEWMEGPEAAPALRLWSALSRRCVAPYEEYAAAPLTLAGWVAWSTGDDPLARVALGLAIEADSHYLFARLLTQACNEGLDPEALRDCLRSERSARTAAGQDREPAPVDDSDGDDEMVVDAEDTGADTGPAGPADRERERRRALLIARRNARKAGPRTPGSTRPPQRADAAPKPPKNPAVRRTGRRGARNGG